MTGGCQFGLVGRSSVPARGFDLAIDAAAASLLLGSGLLFPASALAQEEVDFIKSMTLKK